MKEKLYSEIEVTKDVALEVGLNEEEWEQILKIMERPPTYTEIGMYGVLWSEHCSYKNSIKQIKTLPRSGGKLLVGAGEENAGLVALGGGYGCVFKIESHNHPSAIEPFQGAATGVGGILRDIFTMGARPIAALNSLRFGELNSDRTKYLLKGVVSGIGHYGNCFGVPTVGGEVLFEDCYQDNPLVNAMAVGIVDVNKTATAAASGPGNPVFIIGSSTGRDGIHGASLLASREFDEQTEDMRPTVQVGDPFMEKILLEATLELIDAGVVVGIQDMGAAGISCSSCEMSAKNGVGMEIDLDKVPMREEGMSAYEIMLSESQERMLAVIEKDKEDIAFRICKKWGVNAVIIGKVTDDGLVHIWRNGNKVAELEANTLVLGGGAPQNDREARRPAYLNETQTFDTHPYAETTAEKDTFFKLLNSPNIASKRWVYEQYDSQVRTNTMSIKGDAAVLRVKELPQKALAFSTDGNGKYVYLNPYEGGKQAVVEAARNVACVGARPLAITNCLNFGNPYDPEVYWQFKEAVRGIGDACRMLDTPVTGGNVSFHNESKNKAIFPTPVIGMLGEIEDVNKVMSAEFKNVGDAIFVLGENYNEIGGSEYLKVMHNIVSGDAPKVDLEKEKALIETILTLIDKNIISSAHDISEGGLAIALAEKSILSDGLGCYITLDNNTSLGNIYSESQGRIVVSLPQSKIAELFKICNKYGVQCNNIGSVVAQLFTIKIGLDTAEIIIATYEELVNQYENAIPNLLR